MQKTVKKIGKKRQRVKQLDKVVDGECQDDIMCEDQSVGCCEEHEARQYLAGFGVDISLLLGYFDMLEELRLDILDRFSKRVAELLKILFVQKDLMLLVLIFTDAFALRDCNIEVLL